MVSEPGKKLIAQLCWKLIQPRSTGAYNSAATSNKADGFATTKLAELPGGGPLPLLQATSDFLHLEIENF